MAQAIGAVIGFDVHAEGTGVEQTLVAGGTHTFRSDTYAAFGGSDSAPSPLLYALGALSSCNQVTASLVARDLGIQLGRWTFDVRGDLDPAVLVTGADGDANFRAVHIAVSVETDASAEQFVRLSQETERRCPVTQLFRRSGLAYRSSWVATALPASV